MALRSAKPLDACQQIPSIPPGSGLVNPSGAQVLGEASLGCSYAIDSQAVVDGPDLVVAGSGASVLVFEGDGALTPKHYPNGGAQVILTPQGMVRDVVLTPERLYVAAGRSAIAVYERSTWQELYDKRLELPPASSFDPYEELSDLSVVHLAPGRDFVVAGTRRAGSSGRVLVFDTGLGTDLELVEDLEVAGEIYSVLASTELYPNTLSVLYAGTCQALRAEHYTYASTPGTLVHTGSYAAAQSAGFVRSMVLHHKAAQGWRLYAAAHADGVRGFSLSLGSGTANFALAELTGAGWPIDSSVLGLGPDAPIALAFDAQFERLAVGLQVFFQNEFQFSPGCVPPSPCNDAAMENGQLGVLVYDLSNWAQAPQTFFTGSLGGTQSHAIQVPAAHFRTSAAGNFTLDCASHSKGIAQLVFTDVPLQGWTVLPDWWDLEDYLGLQTNDDLFLMDHILYAASELVARAFALSPGGGFSNVVPEFYYNGNEGPIGLCGFGGVDARLLGIAADGLIVYNASSGAPNNYDLKPLPSTANKALRGLARLCTAMSGLKPTSQSADARWVSIPIIRDDTSPLPLEQRPGALQIWNVGTATQANDPQLAQLAKYTWSASPPDPNVSMRFYGAEVRPLSSSEALIYCSVQRITKTSPTSADCQPGLLRLRATAAQRPQYVTFSDPVFVPLPVAPTPQAYQVWKLHYDPQGSLIYGAFACAGVAVFQDVSGTGTPTLLGHRADLPGPAFEMIRGAGDSLYATTLSGGIAFLSNRFDIGFGALGADPIQYYPTRFQAFGIVIDPDIANRKGVYVADGQAGLLRVQLNFVAYP